MRLVHTNLLHFRHHHRITKHFDRPNCQFDFCSAPTRLVSSSEMRISMMIELYEWLEIAIVCTKWDVADRPKLEWANGNNRKRENKHPLEKMSVMKEWTMPKFPNTIYSNFTNVIHVHGARKEHEEFFFPSFLLSFGLRTRQSTKINNNSTEEKRMSNEMQWMHECFYLPLRLISQFFCSLMLQLWLTQFKCRKKRPQKNKCTFVCVCVWNGRANYITELNIEN